MLMDREIHLDEGRIMRNLLAGRGFRDYPAFAEIACQRPARAQEWAVTVQGLLTLGHVDVKKLFRGC